MTPTRHLLTILLLLLASPQVLPQATLHAQTPAGRKGAKAKASQKSAVKTPAKTAAKTEAKAADASKPLEFQGIRPGIIIDSIRHMASDAGVRLREVQQDTLTHCFADQSIHIYVIDSIYARLTYMRMSFLVDGATNRLRRFTITPRESSIATGQDDDLEDILLLYFGQGWGKPEITLEPPLPNFRWRSGNIQVRGFIKRGYPVWVMEG